MRPQLSVFIELENKLLSVVNLLRAESTIMAHEHKRRSIANFLLAGNSTIVIRNALGVNRMDIKRVRDMLEATGDVLKTENGGQKRTKSSKAVIAAVKQKITRNPRRSIRKLAKEHGMSAATMSRLVRSDLGMRSRAVVTKQLISSRQKLSRFERSKKLLNWIKSNGQIVRVFSDEKNFSVDMTTNRRNLRYISKDRSIDVPSCVKFAAKSKFPDSVMMLGVIASDGIKMDPVFIPVGQRLNAKDYQQLLKDS